MKGSFQVNLYKMIRFLSEILKKYTKLAKIVKISEIFNRLVFPLNFNRFCHPMTYNHWDTLEETVDNPKKVDQVWDAFEKSFEQSTSFWHFRNAYLADFRQDPSETMADLDLHIKQMVRGCQWKKESEEE